MKVLITGTSYGVGRAAALKFLEKGHEVVGFDISEPTIADEKFEHYTVDVRDIEHFPDIRNINIIVNNAGIVTPKKEAIDVNLHGYMNTLKKYGKDPCLKSVVNIGSTASYKGYDNMEYCVSQGGRDALTKWAANNFGRDERHVLVNSINLDGIIPTDPVTGLPGTEMEPELYARPELMEQIKNLSILKRLTTVYEIAEWIYFVTAVNTVMTGQTIMLDGELQGAFQFIPYPGWDS